jgi:hypothetical protein
MRKLLGLFVVLALVSGCGKGGPATAHLAGAVTIKGEPVPADAQAALAFEPLGGGKSVSAKIVDGKYDAPEAPQGAVLVKFYISRPVGPKKVSERTGEEFQEVANIVPPQHAAGIQIEVTGDNTSQDFAL